MVLDLSKMANKESVIIQLLSGPAKGNNMYLRDIRFDNSAGIMDGNDKDGVLVYPVPAKDVLHINFKWALKEARFDLFNCVGSKVVSTIHPGGKEASLDLSTLATGYYFLQVTTTDRTVTRKIMIE